FSECLLRLFQLLLQFVQPGDLEHGVPLFDKWLAYTNRVLPVSSSCITPCLRRRVFSRRRSSAASSVSRSLSTSAMAAWSSRGGRLIEVELIRPVLSFICEPV